MVIESSLNYFPAALYINKFHFTQYKMLLQNGIQVQVKIFGKREILGVLS